MTRYRRKSVSYRAPMRGLLALAVLALMSSAFAAEAIAPLPKAAPMTLIPLSSASASETHAPAAPAAPAPSAPAAAHAPAPAPLPMPSPPPGPETKLPPKGTASVQVNSAPAKPGAADPNEAVRQAIRERMQGSGDLVIRTTDSPPPATEAATVAAPARPAAPPRPVAPPQWSYEGKNGPSEWGKLHSSYALCAKGAFQSPIDLRDGVGVDLPNLKFEFKPSKFKVTDTGKTMQVVYNDGGVMSVMGKINRLVHIEFRNPSEERINGKSFGMSMHLHFRDASGKYSIVSILLTPSPKENPFIQAIWNHTPLMRNQPVSSDLEADLNDVLPANRAYYTYSGSMTTPPCTEGVTWYVMKTPMGVTSDQIAAFARLYPNNTRPIQQANKRLVKESRSAVFGQSDVAESGAVAAPARSSSGDSAVPSE